jgi:hypothetical protein
MRARIDEITTTWRGSSLSARFASNARTQLYVPVRFVATSSSQRSTSPGLVRPADPGDGRERVERSPVRRAAAPNASTTPRGSRMSHPRANALSSSAVARSPSSSRSKSESVQPSAASRRATARPIPRAAPVTAA